MNVHRVLSGCDEPKTSVSISRSGDDDPRPSRTADTNQRQSDQRYIGATICGQPGEVRAAHMIAIEAIGNRPDTRSPRRS
jgi:hypothetical protein